MSRSPSLPLTTYAHRIPSTGRAARPSKTIFAADYSRLRSNLTVVAETWKSQLWPPAFDELARASPPAAVIVIAITAKLTAFLYRDGR